MKRFATFISALLVLTSAAAAQTLIALRENVELVGGTTVRLADIADVTGPDAGAFGEVVVATNLRTAAGPDGVLDLTLSDVRHALQDSNARVNWGRIALSGSTCAVRVAPARGPEVRPSSARQGKAPPQSIDSTGPLTLRLMIAARLAEHFGVEMADLRLGFENVDGALLETNVEGKRVDIQPEAGPGSARLPVNVYVYEDDRIAISRGISISVMVRRTVVTATNIIDRAQTLTPDLVSAQAQWIAPGGKALATPEQAAGAIAANRIPAGQPIALSDLTTAIVVKRGEIVYVHAVTGNVVVKAKARALAPARDGELVQLKLDGSDQVFSARMSGRGQAVLVVPETSDTGTSANGTRVFAPGAKPPGSSVLKGGTR